MRSALRALAESFASVAVPKHGKYVAEPRTGRKRHSVRAKKRQRMTRNYEENTYEDLLEAIRDPRFAEIKGHFQAHPIAYR